MVDMSSLWQIRRSRTDTKLAGLCGGVAEHWQVDPVLVRVGWALLALTGGVGVIVYVAGWLLIPLEGQDRSVADDLFGGAVRRWPREVWVVLVAVACLATFAAFSSVSPFGLGSAVVIAVVWYFGFYRNRGRRDPGHNSDGTPVRPPASLDPTSSPAESVTPFTQAAVAWRNRVQEVTRPTSNGATRSEPAQRAAWSPPPTAEWPTMPPAPGVDPDPVPTAAVDEHAAFLAQPDPVGLYVETVPESAVPIRPGASRSARRLRLATVAALGITLSGLGVAGALGLHVSALTYAAAALLVLGLALVAATWLGRARGMLGLGVLAALTTLVIGVASGMVPGTTTAAAGGFGSREVSYARLADLPSTPDQLRGGELVVDLTALRPTTSVNYAAHVGTGQLVVVVPPDTGLAMTYRVGLGQVDALGREIQGGQNLTGTTELVPAEPGRPSLTLDLSVDQGQIVVRR